MNIHKSYKPLSYLMIICWSGGHPRQFSCLINFRYLTDNGGVYCKGIILQGRNMPSGLPVIDQSCLRIKGNLKGASIYSLRQSNSSHG